MELIRCLGGCVLLFLMAVALDVVGLILLFVGIFANLRLDGRFYGDFFIYTGSLTIFFSLGCWLMWYAGNVQVSEDDGPKRRNGAVDALARKISARLSQRAKGEERVKCVADGDRGRLGSPPRTAGRATRGRSSAYHNEGYDDSLDPPAAESEVETEKEDVNRHHHRPERVPS